MKKVSSYLAILLAVFMLCSIFTACGQTGSANETTSQGTTNAGGTTQAPAASTEAASQDVFKDKVEISIAFWGIEGALSAPDQFIDDLQKKLNVKLTPFEITWDDYVQKIQLWAASSQLPDVFAIDAVGTQNYRNWIGQGVVRALPDDLSQYPTLAKYLDKPDVGALKQDGKLYTVPRSLYDSLDYCAHDRNVFYRWDLAQKAGITKEPETWDEFKAMLKAIVQKDPEGKKIGGMTAVNVKQIGGFFWLYSDPAATSDGSGSDFKWIKDDGKYVPAVLDTKYALPSLVNVRQMYEQGLIDKDIALVKGQEAYDKFASGKAAAILEVGYGNVNNLLLPRWKQLHPDTAMLDAVKRVNYFPSTDGVKYHCTFKTYWSESYFSAQVDDKKMDRIMRFYDYMLQPDVKEFYRFGVKGVDYDKDGDKVVIKTNNDELLKKQPGAGTLGQLVEFDNQFQYDPNNFTFDTAVREAAVANLQVAKAETKLPDYEIKLTDVSTPTKDKFTIFDHDFMLNIMMGKEPVEAMWDKLLKDYEAKGLSKMIDEVNAKAKELGLN